MSKIKIDEIDELLTRGVDKIYPSREKLEEILHSGKKLRRCPFDLLPFRLEAWILF